MAKKLNLQGFPSINGFTSPEKYPIPPGSGWRNDTAVTRFVSKHQIRCHKCGYIEDLSSPFIVGCHPGIHDAACFKCGAQIVVSVEAVDDLHGGTMLLFYSPWEGWKAPKSRHFHQKKGAA